MANSRNIRKAKAKARKAELVIAVVSAFAVDKESGKQSAWLTGLDREARASLLINVNQWGRKGTSCICHPGFYKVV